MPKGKKGHHSRDYSAKAMAFAEPFVVRAAAKELGLHATQLYQWPAEASHEEGVSDRER